MQIIIRAVLSVMLFVGCLFGGNVSLEWDASTTPTVSMYRVYYGSVSNTYPNNITIGNQTTYTVTNLSPGTYYFAVTALNPDMLESEFSNEVSETIPQATSCDVNSDGSVNVLDMQVMANMILGSIPTNLTFDLNLDGVLNVLDLQILTNVILGIRTCP